MKRAAIYLRVSTIDPTTANQERELREIAGRVGYGISAPSAFMEAFHAGFAFRDDPGPTGTVRLLTKDEARKLFPPVFERARLQRNGMHSRSDARWDNRVHDPEHWREGASPIARACTSSVRQ